MSHAILAARVVTQAGGIASTGMFNGSVQRMLDLVPTDIHERCPVILGSARDVRLVVERYGAGSFSQSVAKAKTAAAPPAGLGAVGRTPSFIESGFTTKAEYEAALAK